jgi:putative SOS response-associated peptidase YedK
MALTGRLQAAGEMPRPEPPRGARAVCYSAQVVADYIRYVRDYGAVLSIKDFYDIFWRRKSDPKVKIPKAMEAAFANPQTDAEREIKALIDEFNAGQATKFEQELFSQRKRLADAERTLQTKTTKAATESQRIATDKISWALGKLADLRRIELKDRDARIFPGTYAPVIVMEAGRRVVRPMRYQCRPAGKPAFYDVKYTGTYNARRDNLEGFWKAQFGYTHGVMVINAFYENVNRHKVEGRELAPGEKVENVVLEFRPQPTQDMLVACLWSRWTGHGEPDLLSFAAITDEPPAEIAAAGHDRCIIPIRPEHIDAWLNPDATNRAALQAILDDRERPYYEHRLAA